MLCPVTISTKWLHPIPGRADMNTTLSEFRSTRPLTHNKGSMLFSYVTRTLPEVQKLLQQWRIRAESIPNEMLRRQALDSLTNKAFHCQGGAIYAAYPRNSQLLQFIVAYQTICDYLDNLCDRAGSTDGSGFRQLHQSLLDALDPSRSRADYYENYPHQNDGGYLNVLVEICRQTLAAATQYHQVQPEIMVLAEWYSSLQVAKHIQVEQREQVLYSWANSHLANYPNLYWQEFAAASGSTLAIFALLRQSFMGSHDHEFYQELWDAYFPWICSLHILLDYLIDQEEDSQGGDLNFVFYYDDDVEIKKRLTTILSKCYEQVLALPELPFHEMVVDGLLAMYLSDSKVELQGYESLRRHLIEHGGNTAWRTYRLCRTVRRFL